ncbi:KAP family P-loop NTPase fold protein [Methanobrevibacter sp.]|uniref:KAP family P-loop NTPase fold protein n=1 Tax=Methanobrevibacter sp. TaxID=66852 RepID=UPI002E78EFDD|nr:P-loop NTPase fold protein [Methanobrevibacter sp.]MEE0025252.1 P-loop NTPase fold protein [Methanobrevibacter sp.]
MYNDRPIKNEHQDKLNRTKFADSIAESIINIPKNHDSIVIGLMGDWGTGKSSLLNLIENKIPQDVNILRFNPWNYYSQQTLFASFFDELSNSLSLSNKIRTKFQKYKNKIYMGGITLGSSVVPQVGALANFISDSESGTLDDIKKELDDIFKTQPKTVVIIDDIDRLTPDEIKQIFQLVKSLADFPNLIYILAFDKKYVNYSLKEWNIKDEKYYHTEDFIDKIIQIPLTIPKFNDEDLYKIFESKFTEILSNHEDTDDNLDINKIYSFLKPFFKNIREINRYCNALDFYLYSINNEVWIYDFALLTSIQIFATEIYNEIKYNKDLFTGFFSIYEEVPNISTLDKDNLKIFLKNLFNTNLKYETEIKDILMELFPKVKFILSSEHTSNEEILQKITHYGIMEENYFDLYFTFDTTNQLSQSRINSIILSSKESIESLKYELLKIKKRKLLFKLIYQLKYHIDSFNEKSIKNFIIIFVNDYLELFSNDNEQTDNNELSDSIYFIIELYEKSSLNEEKFTKIIMNTEDNYFKVFLIWELCRNNTLNEKLLEKLKQHISKFLEKYFNITNFSQIEHLRSYINFWKDISGFEKINNYVQNLENENLITLIKTYVNDKSILKDNTIEYEYLSYIVELDFIKTKFIKIKNSNEDLYVKHEELINLFLEGYSDYKNK